MKRFPNIKNKKVAAFWRQQSFSYTDYSEARQRPTKKVATDVFVRKRLNQKDMNDEQRELYKSAINKLIESGEYGEFAGIHSDRTLDIHSSTTTNHRFLPWHRIYLLELERKMNDALDNMHDIFIPYWDWENDRKIPEWLIDFTPMVTVNIRVRNGTQVVINPTIVQVKRWPGTFPGIDLPSSSDMDRDVRNQSLFNDFTENFEIAYHGAVHMWGGGVDPNATDINDRRFWGAFANIIISPADPIFWLHHANIDRIWHEWQTKHINSHPQLSGIKSQMNPWYPPYDEVLTRKTEDLGYTYE
jgi:tyrosinase